MFFLLCMQQTPFVLQIRKLITRIVQLVKKMPKSWDSYYLKKNHIYKICLKANNRRLGWKVSWYKTVSKGTNLSQLFSNYFWPLFVWSGESRRDKQLGNALANGKRSSDNKEVNFSISPTQAPVNQKSCPICSIGPISQCTLPPTPWTHQSASATPSVCTFLTLLLGQVSSYSVTLWEQKPCLYPFLLLLTPAI